MRASKKAGPVRLTASRSGISASIGAGPVRVTRRADGRMQSTIRVPGTGLSYVTAGGAPAPSGALAWRREARAAVPPPPGMRKRRVWLAISAGLTLVGFALPPLLLIAAPMIVTMLVIMLRNLRTDMAWYRQYRAHLKGVGR